MQLCARARAGAGPAWRYADGMSTAAASAAIGFLDANRFGFAPGATGTANMQALQRAVDQGGTIVVSRPGIYDIAGTVLLGSHTTVQFGNGVVLRKVDEQGPFSHVLLNKGALSKTWDQGIAVIGLSIVVNGMDVCTHRVFGLRGQLAFHYVRDLRIERFRCHDLGRGQYCIHVCTFEDLIVDDVIISGGKDGVHLGRGRRFRISNGVFNTLDDAVALNAHDYDTGNPEMGWIEDGLVENCHDLQPEKPLGFFARILAGAWIDWRSGMEVQKSDTVVSEGRLYRVRADPDGRVFTSVTRPTHTSGSQVIDGITWVMVQDDVTYTAGVRRVTFRDIWLRNPRIGFSIHFDNGWYSRSYYPGAPVPRQEQIAFEGIRVVHDGTEPFLSVATPIDAITIANSTLGLGGMHFIHNRAMPEYHPTRIVMTGCTCAAPGSFPLVVNEVPDKAIAIATFASQALHEDFRATVSPGPGRIQVRSDLPGLAAAS